MKLHFLCTMLAPNFVCSEYADSSRTNLHERQGKRSVNRFFPQYCCGWCPGSQPTLQSVAYYSVFSFLLIDDKHRTISQSYFPHGNPHRHSPYSHINTWICNQILSAFNCNRYLNATKQPAAIDDCTLPFHNVMSLGRHMSSTIWQGWSWMMRINCLRPLLPTRARIMPLPGTCHPHIILPNWWEICHGSWQIAWLRIRQ